MKTKLQIIFLSFAFTIASTHCNPSVPSSINSQIGLIGEIFLATPKATGATAGTATNNGIGITYGSAIYIFTIKIAVTPVSPIISEGTPTAYSINPSLPTGLSLDTSTGVISGTATNILIPTNHTVTATGPTGSGTYTFQLTIYGTPLTKTGQTACYNTAGSVISCTGTGQDGELRKGIDASFTGPITNVGYGSDYITTDNNTGLTWWGCTAGVSGSTCSGGTQVSTAWATATSSCTANNSVNSGNGYAGLTGWRLPTTREYITIQNYGNQNPAAYTANFPNFPSHNCGFSNNGHWTNETDATNGSNAWVVNFGDCTGWYTGFTYSNSKAQNQLYRCVSPGVGLPTKVYYDNGDQTILDVTTGLTWTKCALGLSGSSCIDGTAETYTWATVFSACSSLSLSGKTWRVPNFNELMSIVDRTRYNPPHDTTYFPGAVGRIQSTTNVGMPSDASPLQDSGYIGGNGSNFSPGHKTTPYAVRCVTGP